MIGSLFVRFVRSDEHLCTTSNEYRTEAGWEGARGSKAEKQKAEAATRTSYAPPARPTRAPRSLAPPPAPGTTRGPATGVRAGDGSRVRLVFKFNKIQETYTQMRETRVLKTTDVSRSVPVAVSRPQPG